VTVLRAMAANVAPDSPVYFACGKCGERLFDRADVSHEVGRTDEGEVGQCGEGGGRRLHQRVPDRAAGLCGVQPGKRGTRQLPKRQVCCKGRELFLERRALLLR
jgi:hypothetical protein